MNDDRRAGQCVFALLMHELRTNGLVYSVYLVAPICRVIHFGRERLDRVNTAQCA